ncbi:MAG: tRNA (guanosine(37)-N1)-methyltransferase TrmD [Candidatus Wallacebacter cryptica]|nr:tRNA (guanosine(37)-N1)-methyltransferase TrmD [Bacillota bacterium]
MRIDVLTLFPNMFTEVMGTSIIGRAQARDLVEINLWNIRDFALDKHRVVDDTPYGGGAGMVMKPDVLAACIEHVKSETSGRVIYLAPQGSVFNQALAERLAKEANLIFLCGHYEGIDQRIRDHWIDEEISIGDYVLTGGELPAMVVIDAVVRLIPGVLGDDNSAQEESFADGLLEYPHYTRPADFGGLKVPNVLLSGNHELIRRWRLKEALRITMQRRPDLIEKRQLTEEEKTMLQELAAETVGKGGNNCGRD